MRKNNIKRKLKTGAFILCAAGAFVFLQRLAKATGESESLDADNEYIQQETELPEPIAPSLYERFGKKALDKVLSFAGLVVLAPVFAAIALAIEIDDPGPVLFKQKRVGKDKHFFEMHKFRSMKMSAPKEVPAEAIGDQDRYVTRVGRFLRKTSLDELPQLWDVFRGRMSLVGPRPVIWTTRELINERDKYSANNVKPGITGLAQINGRDRLNNTEKAELDGQYVKSLRGGLLEGFLMDAGCLKATLDAVVAEYKREKEYEV